MGPAEKMTDAQPSGSITIPPVESHPTLGRAMANPVVKMAFGAIGALVGLYVAVLVTMISGRLDSIDQRQDNADGRMVVLERRIDKLEQFDARHEGSHQAADKARGDRTRRWEIDMKDARDRGERSYEAFMKSLDK